MNAMTGIGGKPSLRNFPIVIFSDKQPLMDTMKGHLKELGFSVVKTTTDAERVLPMMRQDRAEFLIADLDIMDGSTVQVIETVRHDEQVYRVPVMVLTAHASKDVILKAARAGANDVLLKPFTLRDLGERLTSALSKQTKQRVPA